MGTGARHVLIVFAAIFVGVPALMGAIYLVGRGNNYSLYSAAYQTRNTIAGLVLAAIVIAAWLAGSYLINLLW